jgi:putative transposase
MKAKRFSEEQIIGVLKEAEAGAKTKDLCRQHGISGATFYNWKAKYAGMTVSEARRLKELEQENAMLKPSLFLGTYLVWSLILTGHARGEVTAGSNPSFDTMMREGLFHK